MGLLVIVPRVALALPGISWNGWCPSEPFELGIIAVGLQFYCAPRSLPFEMDCDTERDIGA